MLKKIRTTTGAEFGFTGSAARIPCVIARCDACFAEFPYSAADYNEDAPCYDCMPDDRTAEEIAEEDAILEEMKVELMRDGKVPMVWS